MNRWSALAALLLAFVAALALRLPHLSARPLHNDEAVNATKVTELLQHGRYRYDPDEFHGPTLHYFSLPFLWLSSAGSSPKAGNSDGITDDKLRLVTVFFGAGLILLLLLFRDALEKQAIAWSALFIAISPSMVFYSRYFIHEMLLVFFTALLLGSGWRYYQTRRSLWAALAGASIGLMYATKETFVITLAAIFIAAFGTRLGRARACPARASARAAESPNASEQTKSAIRNPESAIPWFHFAVALAAALLMWLLFFSSFFTNFAGLADSIRTYLPWLKRASGHSPHIHPWYFYLQRLGWFHPLKSPVWSEGLILALAIVGAVVSIRRKQPLPIFITIYTIVLTAAYSAISYKTPWCLLSFLFGMILLAGIGASTLIASISNRVGKVVTVLALIALSAQLTGQSCRANFVMMADQRNPYVYAQTVPDLLNLVDKVQNIAAISDKGFATVVKVITPGGDYWPLPWYLRRLQNVGWYEKLPDDPYAPIIIVAAQLDARLDEKSDKKWIMVGLTEMRPGKFFELYVEVELWKKYVAKLPPPRD